MTVTDEIRAERERPKIPAGIIAAALELYEALKAQEAWEADVIMNADWSSGRAHLTQAQHDALADVQAKRNAALAKAEETERLDRAQQAKEEADA